MIPLGRQGFSSSEEAQASARAELHGLQFCVVAQGDNFGWVYPKEHAKRICGERIRLVEECEA